MIDNINDINKMGVRGVAKNNFTSTSTIMRLAKKLGYSGFLEMQYNLLSLTKNELKDNLNDSGFIESLNMDSLLEENSTEAINNFIDILFNDDHKFIFYICKWFFWYCSRIYK